VFWYKKQGEIERIASVHKKCIDHKMGNRYVEINTEQFRYSIATVLLL
jgi:hypothetical protein